ncbi:hypothetical protein LIER_41828 [Lithospermum erythrorhizon]|uniref:Uncharacterized protein n=1 Tax=Lithospermum erythrorhizon TaxID=34254 RepID=A0AAV3RF18_LITER
MVELVPMCDFELRQCIHLPWLGTSVDIVWLQNKRLSDRRRRTSCKNNLSSMRGRWRRSAYIVGDTRGNGVGVEVEGVAVLCDGVNVVGGEGIGTGKIMEEGV